jgi:hypothetical protein
MSNVVGSMDDKEPAMFQLAVLRIGVLLTVVPCIQDVAT